MLIDTGAQITLIADDVIIRGIKLNDFIVSLTGISGENHAITTRGNFMGDFITENGMKWPAQIHAVDREHAGQYDGYLGYDFLEAFGAN